LPFYTFRHTCLTRWSPHMDPYTLAYFAGHMRIPLKWGTDSGDVGQRRSGATLVTAMISEVPHLSQDLSCLA